MMLAEWHLELFVHLEVDIGDARTNDGVAPDIAEESWRSLDERRRIQPAGRRAIAGIGTGAGGDGPVVAVVGRSRVVNAANAQRPWNSALHRKDTAGLPAARDAVQNPIADPKSL